MPLASDSRKRVAISDGAKLSAMETTTQPARIVPRYAMTAYWFIGMSIAMASPVWKPAARREFAKQLQER